jgi:hypothetical protein
MHPAPDPGSDSAPESLFPQIETDGEPTTIAPPSGSPGTPPAGTERIELLPEADRKLRRIADAIGLRSREVLGHLLKHASQQIRQDTVPETAVDRAESGCRAGATMILRRIPVGPVDNQRLREWQADTGGYPSVLIERRITKLYDQLSTGRLDDTTTENPLDAYQLFLEVLHEHSETPASPNGTA